MLFGRKPCSPRRSIHCCGACSFFIGEGAVTITGILSKYTCLCPHSTRTVRRKFGVYTRNLKKSGGQEERPASSNLELHRSLSPETNMYGKCQVRGNFKNGGTAVEPVNRGRKTIVTHVVYRASACITIQPADKWHQIMA